MVKWRPGVSPIEDLLNLRNSFRMFATSFLRFTYRFIAKPFFFRRDPEDVHDAVTAVGAWVGRFAFARHLTSFFLSYQDPILVQDVAGIRFPNPIGLTAGFDKNARLTRIMPAVGFGFEEIGSVTGEPCEGNPRPRLWRLPQSKGLVVYYGLKNDGCEVVSDRLRGETFRIPLGMSVARTNLPAFAGVEEGIADYAKAFRAFADIGDYFAVNVSCPNTCGGEPFTDPERLEKLLTVLDAIPTKKPVFLKVPVDAPFEDTRRLMEVAATHRVQGFILSNLTKKRDRPEIVREEIAGLEKGGVSGRPTFAVGNEQLSQAYQAFKDRFVFIASGGVFTAEDAYEKIRRGASLVQLATGMIFEGPQLIGELNRGLAALLRRDGYRSVAEAVGAAYR